MSILAEARAFARQIVEDPEYRKALLIRARNGYLAPALETMLWAYVYGKPPERIEVGRIGESELEKLSDEQLRTYARRVLADIETLPALTDGATSNGAISNQPTEPEAEPPPDSQPEEPSA